jgi:Ca-activated chloride channel family protein
MQTMRDQQAATLAASFFFILYPAISAEAQARQPRFGAGVEVVNLNVSVTDVRGRYVKDLQDNDFVVLEDGVQQNLLMFARDDIPVSLSLLIDTSGSMADKLQVAQDAALRFIRNLRAGDTAQIVQFNERVTVLQDFTDDLAALEAAIRKTRPSGATALHTAVYVALKELSNSRRGELRRRAVVLLSDGEDTSSSVSEQQVVELGRRSEINVYAISIRHHQPSESERANYDRSVHFLTTLARETGGEVHLASAVGELEPLYGRIAEELRTLYTIGYVSANERRDGKWRKVVVLTPNRDSVVLRHRTGYYAPRETAP